jgi:hypothetical protein
MNGLATESEQVIKKYFTISPKIFQELDISTKSYLLNGLAIECKLLQIIPRINMHNQINPQNCPEINKN